eukprot:1389517-Amphidinium_carterae.1
MGMVGTPWPVASTTLVAVQLASPARRLPLPFVEAFCTHTPLGTVFGQGGPAEHGEGVEEGGVAVLTTISSRELLATLGVGCANFLAFLLLQGKYTSSEHANLIRPEQDQLCEGGQCHKLCCSRAMVVLLYAYILGISAELPPTQSHKGELELKMLALQALSLVAAVAEMPHCFGED